MAHDKGSRQKCVVLVTGGAGFLGQHVVGLLQTRAEHVTEIVVVDVVPFENKLDYVHTKPLRSYVGSITDKDILRNACKGVQSIIHIAGVADASMFPDEKRTNEVNVHGTLVTVLTGLETSGMQRLINCSSDAVGISYDSDVTSAIHESNHVTNRFIFEPYASSKLKGERIALSANSESFRVLSIRPVVMYGELDVSFVTAGQTMAAKSGGTLITIDCGDVKQQYAYVGNVAWGFVCAEIKLHGEQNASKARTKCKTDERTTRSLCSELRRRSIRMSKENTTEDTFEEGESNEEEELNLNTDNVYYICDDTPPMNPFNMQTPYLKESGYQISRFSLPIPLALFVFFIIHWVFRCLRLFNAKFNYPISKSALWFFRKPFIFDDSKARRELNYAPLFPPHEAYQRSLKYYKQNPYK